MAEEEVLEVRPRRYPPWLVAVGSLVLVAIAVWALAHRGPGDGSVPRAAETSAVPSTSTSAAILPFDAAGSVRGQLLSYVFERAHDPARAGDLVREDTSTTSCALVPRGLVPTQRMTSFVASEFPHMRVLDFARIFDKFAGLCALELRARDGTGSVLIVRVVAPIEDAPLVDPRVDEGAATANGSYTRFVRVMTRDGWIVTAGVSGPGNAGASLHTLLAVAQQRSLFW